MKVDWSENVEFLCRCLYRKNKYQRVEYISFLIDGILRNLFTFICKACTTQAIPQGSWHGAAG